MHILLTTGHDQKTQDPNILVDSSNENRFTSSSLIFLQSNPNKMVQQCLFLQVYTTKSSIHWWYKEYSDRHILMGWLRVNHGSLGDMQGVSHQACCVNSFLKTPKHEISLLVTPANLRHRSQSWGSERWLGIGHHLVCNHK